MKVFLGQPRLNSYLSRLNYLKAQNIPVFTRPQHGFIAPTVLFVDQRLFTISRDLNVLVRQGPAQILQAPPADVATFVSWFKGMADLPIPAEPRPLPAVGRASGSRPVRNWRNEEQRSGSASPAVSSYQGEENGSYNYDRSRLPRQAPEGIPTKLPKVLRWQKIESQKLESAPDQPASEIAPRPNPVGPANPVEKSIEPGPQSPSSIEAIDPIRPGTDVDSMNSPSEER